MANKDLRRLNRRDLLEMLIELSEENDYLRNQNDQLAEQLNDQEICIANAGSIADAVLQLDYADSSANKTSHRNIHNTEQLQSELNRVEYNRRFRSVLKSTVYTLITVAAVAVLVATLWLPVLQIYGSSMTPTLQDGEIVLSVKTADLEQGDVIAFYYNNKILVKRVIAGPGDWVDICPETGNVSKNNVLLDEPYLAEKSFGDADIEFPFQVPDGKIFVMGDHRSTSVDSRHEIIGCVAEEQIVGKIVFRIWPLSQFGGL